VIAVLAYAPTSPVSSSMLMNCGCRDSAQEVWFLAWTSFAVTHLHNPLYSNWMEYPAGANMMANTAYPLLGLLATPVTLIAGPVASLNFLLRLGFAATATSGFAVLRRFAPWGPAAFLGGLLYGFSPYMVGEGLGHAFLLFAPLPPLIFLAIERLVRGEAPARWLGLAIGGLAGMQLYISSEILFTTVIMVIAGLAVWALAARHEVREKLHRLAAGTAWAAGTFAVLAAYGLYVFFDGPQHTTGPPRPVSILSTYHADLLSAFIPTSSEWLAPFSSVGNRLSGGNITETGAYLGIPFLVLLGVLAVRHFREPMVRFGLALAGIAYLLSLGPWLEIDGVDTHIPLPFALFVHLPLFDGLISGRFAMYTAFFCALVLAVGLDRSYAALAAREATGQARVRGSALAALAAACLVPLIPNFPYHEVPAGVPTYFTSSASKAIPEGSVVLLYPYPWTPNNEGQLWQAVNGLHFRIFGGEGIVPGHGDHSDPTPARLTPQQVQALFLSAIYGRAHTAAGVLPPENERTAAAIRAFCRKYGVSAVLVSGIGAEPRQVLRYLEQAFGRPPTSDGGVYAWYGVG
jgi:hypothetical protein